jgi:hypothetical protein
LNSCCGNKQGIKNVTFKKWRSWVLLHRHPRALGMENLDRHSKSLVVLGIMRVASSNQQSQLQCGFANLKIPLGPWIQMTSVVDDDREEWGICVINLIWDHISRSDLHVFKRLRECDVTSERIRILPALTKADVHVPGQHITQNEMSDVNGISRYRAANVESDLWEIVDRSHHVWRVIDQQNSSRSNRRYRLENG